MTDAIAHRGPDGEGFYMDNFIGLGHRRLAILDLTPAAHQPMATAQNQYVITYNGEVYNFRELRTELETLGHQFRSCSDTEVVLYAYMEWGAECLNKFNGHFAFAIWDKLKQELFLARDRLGTKPLYYGWVGKSFAFASEIKAIRTLPGFSNPINRAALALFMCHNAIPSPYSIYENIYKLLPGKWMTISQKDVRCHSLPESNTYWRLLDVGHAGLSQRAQFTNDLATMAILEKSLLKAVQDQMIADVPLGAFLSGGIDSSLIVALMQAQSSVPVKTFTIGFHEHVFNEAPYAKQVARHLGTDHEELYVTDSDTLAVIPQLPSIYDEPFSDSSQIPTFLISRMAGNKVRVVLSGDGGDEMFGGYERYFISNRLWQKLLVIPKPLRLWIGMFIRGIPVEVWNNFSPLISPFLPRSKYSGIVGDKLHKGALMLLSLDSGSFYINGFMSHWNPNRVVLGIDDISSPLMENWAMLSDYPTFIEKMMALDALRYLPDDGLVKVDRAAMAVGLETRTPFLDHRIVELAWCLPLHYKVRGGVGKWIEKELLKKFIPKKLIDRPKMGFGVPLDSWLRGPLKEWAEELLDERRLKREGYLNHIPIRKKWAEHLTGQRNWHGHLWDVLMFQAWLAEQDH